MQALRSQHGRTVVRRMGGQVWRQQRPLDESPVCGGVPRQNADIGRRVRHPAARHLAESSGNALMQQGERFTSLEYE